MAELPLAGLTRVIGPLLSLLGQKLYVFVEVSMGQEKPYALTILNRSGYQIVLENLQVDPDGFPKNGNGWHISDSKLFQSKVLQPGQRIRMFLSTKDVGEEKVRHFKARYSTQILGWKVPRIQVADCEFPTLENTIRVRSTL